MNNQLYTQIKTQLLTLVDDNSIPLINFVDRWKLLLGGNGRLVRADLFRAVSYISLARQSVARLLGSRQT